MTIHAQQCLSSLALGGLFLKSKENRYLQGTGTLLYKLLIFFAVPVMVLSCFSAFQSELNKKFTTPKS